jgi:transcriptional regulator with XRE-family HTH domain
MADHQALSLRAKMLGASMRMARKAAGKTVKDAADLIGLKRGTMTSYESGRKSITLPELEVYAYHLGIPLKRFWEFEEDEQPNILGDDVEVVIGLRNRMIAAVLHGHRTEAGLSIRDLTKATGLSSTRISAYERGERPVPVPHLEALAEAMGHSIQEYVDRQGPVGDWDAGQRALEVFLRLPPRLREFLADPGNRPYLELARRLSELSVERLRLLGEGLLDITE